MSASMMAAAIAAGVAGSIALCAALAASVFRARMLVPGEAPEVPVTLVLPATGPLPGLDELVAALAAQTLRPARLIVAVESREDPAWRRAAETAAAEPALRIELVVAGRSDERAQKCTNLLAAFAKLGPDDRYIVLLDADILPQPWWLAALVAPLAAGRADIVNGYRWQLPEAVSAATLLGAGIDRAIATLPRLRRFNLLWGGSLALTSEALRRIDPPTALSRTLSDDFTIADRSAALRLRILTRRALRVPTPLGGRLAEVWRFGRRQYQIARIFRPAAWRLAAAAVTADVAARTILLGAAMAGSGAVRVIGIAALVGIAGIGSVTIGLRQSIGRRLGVADPAGFTAAQHLLGWSLFAVPLFHAGIIWAGAFGSTVTWRHVRYSVDRKGRVVAAQRSARSARLAGDQQQFERVCLRRQAQ